MRPDHYRDAAEILRDVLAELAEAKQQVEKLEHSRDNWQKTARQESRNTDYYRGLVVAIGEMFGQEAKTSDDGMVHDEVLCAKVPELVARLHAELAELKQMVVEVAGQ